MTATLDGGDRSADGYQQALSEGHSERTHPRGAPGGASRVRSCASLESASGESNPRHPGRESNSRVSHSRTECDDTFPRSRPRTGPNRGAKPRTTPTKPGFGEETGLRPWKLGNGSWVVRLSKRKGPRCVGEGPFRPAHAAWERESLRASAMGVVVGPRETPSAIDARRSAAAFSESSDGVTIDTRRSAAAFGEPGGGVTNDARRSAAAFGESAYGTAKDVRRIRAAAAFGEPTYGAAKDVASARRLRQLRYARASSPGGSAALRLVRLSPTPRWGPPARLRSRIWL